MDVPTVVAHVLTFNTNTFVRPALQGLSDADLLKRPSDACNPIGWLLWHQTRVEDAMLSPISGSPQTWVADQRHAQFGMPADPHDSGRGHSPEQVMALQPTMARAARLCRGSACQNAGGFAQPDTSRSGARVPLPGRWYQNSLGLAGHCTD